MERGDSKSGCNAQREMRKKEVLEAKSADSTRRKRRRRQKRGAVADLGHRSLPAEALDLHHSAGSIHLFGFLPYPESPQ